MTIQVILNVLILLVLIFVLNRMAKKHISFSKRVFFALFVGIVLGIVFHNVYDADTLAKTKDYYNIVGQGYVGLLRMISMPLIIVSILGAIINLRDTNEASKMGTMVISVLLATAAIASMVSAIVTMLFKLDASNIVAGTREIEAGERILSRVATTDQTMTQRVLAFIPQNPFLDMTGARATSIIAVVIFCAFVGIAILGIKNKKEASAKIIIDFINALNDVVMRLVTIVLRLTPYGVLALITNVTATSDYVEIYKLIQFVLASYVALIIMYLIHLLIVAMTGYSPIVFVKKTLALLSFAFTSRTSAGSIPLTIKTQENLGIERGLANMAATFGASIGQNGCAAIYPTMLAIMIAPSVGISLGFNVASLPFLIKLVAIVTVSSLGVAGVGGGATFAAIIVLITLGFPVELVGLLISVEPLIDMGRTALNVNDSVLAGFVSARMLGKLDGEKYYSKVEE